jgi:dihydropyrimidinase
VVHLDLIIKNGTIVTAHEIFKGDIGIKNEKIVMIGSLSNEKADTSIDAQGKYIFPGIIDVHTHMDNFFGEENVKDYFYQGSLSAAFGGVTTFIDYGIQKPGEEVMESLQRIREGADGRVCTDYGLHANLAALTDKSFNAIPEVINDGCSTFKLFMAYKNSGLMVDDAVLYEVMDNVNKNGGMVGVHAENESICEYLAREFEKEGLVSPEYQAKSRPNIAEAECISKAILFAEHTKSLLYIFNLTTSEGVRLVKEAREKGIPVMAETCPQYLLFTREKYRGENGQKYLMSPPLRDERDIEALWDGIKDGVISVVSSNHCEYSEKRRKKSKTNFHDITLGIPGVETLLPIMYHFGVNKGRISLNKLIEILSSNPSKIFGLFPQKGNIAIGADADIVIFDPEKRVIINKNTLHMKAENTVFDDIEVKGYPEKVILRGKVIISNSEFTGYEGFGRFIERKKPKLL